MSQLNTLIQDSISEYQKIRQEQEDKRRWEIEQKLKAMIEKFSELLATNT